ncbi:MAG: hypothetical protein OM95_08620 [Bdellovibrio sp. ArHS]|uniref:hypothetical protein n=1 Tax=Bdellovibrio sp. ArHS TaxID=1569284 RepID=UPI000582E4EE|nr:hypothetical protein [Bdellovibrio sp. ArHS]KHD88558.1 MAG: hypothetical protein OM95_08620 [Bdellovibrio sp. ArHS]
MLSKKIAGVFFVTAISFSAWAKKEIVFFGGGGEPDGQTTIFDSTYGNFAPFKQGSGWTARSYFDGGHHISEALAQDMFKGKNKPMTAKNMNAEIASLKQRIQKGDLKSGDQLLITVATHGVKQKEGQRTHSVTTTDDDFNMDELKALRDLAEAKGVRLGIVDMSCHSGPVTALGSDKTCVVSMGGEGVSWNISGDKFGQLLTKGNSLEDAFLASRRDPQAVVLGTPQISSDAGRRAYNATKFLKGALLDADQLYESSPNEVSCYGTASLTYLRLVNDLIEIDKTGGFQSYYKHARIHLGFEKSKNQPVIDNMKEALDDYNITRARLATAHKQAEELNKPECVNVLNARMCGTKEQFISGVTVLSAKKKAQGLNAKEAAELASYQNYINSAAFKKWEALRASFKNDTSLQEKAMKVAKAEREVYDELYRIYSAESKKENPCKDFKL